MSCNCLESHACTYIVYVCMLFSFSVMEIITKKIVSNKMKIRPCKEQRVKGNNAINKDTISLVTLISYSSGLFSSHLFIPMLRNANIFS